MLGVMARFLRRCASVYHGLRGRLAWRLGFTGSARHHFERVLGLGGDEFTAYVHLGRIALGEGDYAGYRREMSNARATDPERYARLRMPTEGLEPRAAGTPFEETGERATWRSVRPGGHGFRRPAIRSAEVPTEFDDQPRPGQQFDLPFMSLEDLEERGAGVPRHRRDDFGSTTERERFRRLPPIRRDEIVAADLDEIARRLGR